MCGVELNNSNCYPSALRKNDHRCNHCWSEYYNNYQKTRRMLDQEYADNLRRMQKISKARIKIRVIYHYSFGTMRCQNPKCEVSGGASDIRCLTIDHLTGGGRKHRQEIDKNIYYWLIKNNFPEGFQILCMNCQFIKRQENGEFVSHDKLK